MSQEGGVQFQAFFLGPNFGPKTSGILHLNLRNNLGLFWLGGCSTSEGLLARSECKNVFVCL